MKQHCAYLAQHLANSIFVLRCIGMQDSIIQPRPQAHAIAQPPNFLSPGPTSQLQFLKRWEVRAGEEEARIVYPAQQ